MLVLAQGLVPSTDMKQIQEMLSLQKTSDGFYLEAHPKLQPVDSASKGIFFAGTAEGPKDIKDSVTQASATAARAARLMSPGRASRSRPSPARVDGGQMQILRHMRRGLSVQRHHAWTKRTKSRPSVIQAACTGCGTCAAECPFDAIEMNHFTDEQILTQVTSLPGAENPAGEQDRLLRLQLVLLRRGRLRRRLPPGSIPANVRLIRTMCSGRVDEKFVLVRL